MRVIKRGDGQKKPRKVTCSKCRSVLEYEQSDVVHDWKEDDHYIVCPVCAETFTGSYISVKYMK